MDYRQQAEEFAAFLLALPKGKRTRTGSRVHGNCPRPEHEDADPSFGYDAEMDAFACSCCSGKGSYLRDLLGWKTNGNGHGPPPPKPDMAKLAIFTPDRPPDCTHLYQNGNRKLRWYYPDGSKKIVWEQEVNGQWILGKQGDAGLYNEPAISTTETVYLSESETDVDALTSVGLVGSCHGSGASSNLKDEQAALFKRKRVPILEHADDAGRKWAEAQLGILTRAGADAWIVHMPEGTKDIRDYIKAGADKFAVEFLAQAFEPRDLLAEESGKLFERTPDTIDYILDPLLSKGCIVQIQGTPKAGKSSFALMLALSCAIGRWMAGRLTFVGGPRRTLYISYEDSARRLKRRARSYLDAMGYRDGFPPTLLLFPRAPDLDLASKEGRAKLDKIIRQNKIEVLFIDTLSWVAAGDENTKKDMQPVLATLRYIAEEYGTAICIIHHTRKTSQSGDMAGVSERGRGSSAIAAAADSILDFGSRVSPNHTLCKFISKDADEDEFIAVYKTQEDGSIAWSLEEVVEREDSVAIKNRIIEAISKLSVTSSEITVSLIHETMKDTSINTVRGYVKALADDDKLTVTKGPNRSKFYAIKSPN